MGGIKTHDLDSVKAQFLASSNLKTDFDAVVNWYKYFIEAKLYSLENVIIYQDNQSAMLFEKNGKK